MPEQFGDKQHEATPYRRQKAREQGEAARSHDLASAMMLICGSRSCCTSAAGWRCSSVPLTRNSNWGKKHGCRWTVIPWWLTGLPPTATVRQAPAANPGPYPAGGHRGPPGPDRLPVPSPETRSRSEPNDPRCADSRGSSPGDGGSPRLRSLQDRGRRGGGLRLHVARGGERSWNSATRPSAEIAAYAIQVTLWTSPKIGAALLILAVLDYGYQRWKHEQDLRMTTQELREEMKTLRETRKSRCGGERFNASW